MNLTVKNAPIAALLCALPLFSFSQYELPNGWWNAGSALVSYNFGIDKEIRADGDNSAYIKSVDKEIDGFATLMQSCNAVPFKGKKIKMIGYAKSENIGGWAGFWLRIDGEDKEEALGFDNMAERPIEGTNDWAKYEIIMEVPDNSVSLAYGLLLYGTGKIWFDNITFQEITEEGGKNTATTITEGPTNTNFEN